MHEFFGHRRSGGFNIVRNQFVSAGWGRGRLVRVGLIAMATAMAGGAIAAETLDPARLSIRNGEIKTYSSGCFDLEGQVKAEALQDATVEPASSDACLVVKAKDGRLYNLMAVPKDAGKICSNTLSASASPVAVSDTQHGANSCAPRN